jgi:hypothetical protein
MFHAANLAVNAGGSNKFAVAGGVVGGSCSLGRCAKIVWSNPWDAVSGRVALGRTQHPHEIPGEGSAASQDRERAFPLLRFALADSSAMAATAREVESSACPVARDVVAAGTGANSLFQPRRRGAFAFWSGVFKHWLVGHESLFNHLILLGRKVWACPGEPVTGTFRMALKLTIVCLVVVAGQGRWPKIAVARWLPLE